MTEKESAKGKTLVVGYGSDIRSDDAAGIFAINYLKERLDSKDYKEKVELMTGLGAIDLVNLFNDYEHLLLIDAAFLDKEPGFYSRVEYGEIDFPDDSSFSHDMNFASLIPLAKSLDYSVPKMVFYLIQPKVLEVGETLSENMKAGFDKMMVQIADELDSRYS